VRLIKTFGLAAIAALAAMAFVGASSASASTTALCSVNESPCAAGNLVTHVHYVDPSPILLSTINVQCNALFLGDALGLVTNGPVLVHGSFTYTNCNEGCEVEDLKGGLILVLRTAANLGEVKGDGFEISVTCLGVIECEYTGANLVGHGLGANLPTTAGDVSISEQQVDHKSRSILDICPAKAKLDAKFVSLADMYLTT
jgi:hypothetical protein